MYEDGASCPDDRRDIEYCNHHHDCYNGNHGGKAPFSLKDWIPMFAILGALVVSWTTLNTTIVKIEVNQENLKDDFKDLEDSFSEHNILHMESMKDIKSHVNSLEHSLTALSTRRGR